MTTPLDPARCPLCGEANDCRIAAGCSPCWCFETPVPAEVLARVPVDVQGVVCVCSKCATSSDPEVLRRRLAMRWTRR